MKTKSKFASLLNAGGSLLSKDKLARRFQLPRGKAPTAEQPKPQEALFRKRGKPAGLSVVVERILRESGPERKPTRS